ncbi:MAG: DNA mismatch repair protein MutS, partial [Bacillota bacterium]
DKVLDHKENNFLAGLHLGPRIVGVSFLDISTGEFYLAEGSKDYVDNLLQSFRPNEVILQKSKQREFIENFGDKFYTSTFDDWVFTPDFANNILLNHFQTTSLKGFGIDDLDSGIIAAGAALHYLAETQHDKISHISKLSRIEEDRYVWIDRFTIRNLELLHSSNEKALTLLDIIDQTLTPMGSRLLKRWFVMPLKDKQRIEERLNIVEHFIKNDEFSEELRKNVKLIGDLERLISKVAIGKINPREVVQIKRALNAIEHIKTTFDTSENLALKKIGEQLNSCKIIRDRIEHDLNDDPPALAKKGKVIANGVSEGLDELRQLAYSGKDYLVQVQQRESELTGIPSLKISFNNVFGYYIEVTNTHKNKVPDTWTRKQTLANCERYITEELKEYEEKILGAEEKILALETELYNELVIALFDYIKPIQLNASLTALTDCLLSFATIAVRNNYTRPHVNESLVIDIKNGRHPVIEQNLPAGEKYIANDVYLDDTKQQIIIITGPNMAGKSALLRQTALIVLLAQIGSYVPAESAEIGIVDKIFTRVGASDNISSGESTFMVEMNETASILNNISSRSLILLDEIGRGTSTYDGISIAWAIAEYLHENRLFKPKVLFATHYHELNEMAKSMPGIKNYHVSVKEISNKIIFLRKLVPGGTEHSFGIHVAKMAGIPQRIIDRANELLHQLEKDHSNSELTVVSSPKQQSNPDNYQLSFIQLDDPLLEQIKDDILKTDINTLTPVEALMKLNEIKNLLKKKK